MVMTIPVFHKKHVIQFFCSYRSIHRKTNRKLPICSINLSNFLSRFPNWCPIHFIHLHFHHKGNVFIVHQARLFSVLRKINFTLNFIFILKYFHQFSKNLKIVMNKTPLNQIKYSCIVEGWKHTRIYFNYLKIFFRG